MKTRNRAALPPIGSALLILAASCGLVGCDSTGTPDNKEAAAMFEQPTGDRPASQEDTTPYVLDHVMKRIDGTDEALSSYRGKVVMMVNVASQCGLTPQYAGLEALYESRKDAGLVILGFPANDFMEQEPGTNEQIAEFCTTKFGVSFPMYEKISVKGEAKHPLYEELSRQGGEPSWNFTKYLVDRSGHVVARFDPRTTPDDAGLVARIEELLAAQGGE